MKEIQITIYQENETFSYEIRISGILGSELIGKGEGHLSVTLAAISASYDIADYYNKQA